MHHLRLWNYLSLPWLAFALIFFFGFFYSAFFYEIDTQFLSSKYLFSLFKNTLVLSIATGFISALIAVPLAIIVTLYKFPGHNFFSWALSLSIAFPAYIYAFIFVGAFEYASPLATFFREIGIYLPSIKNLFGASVVMSMALFPYIYLLAKAQLATMGVSLFKAAKTLGNTNYQAIKKIIIPSLWPAILAGVILVILETIADFGGVSTLNINTFTVGIYNAWFGYQSYYSGARLAAYLLIFVFFFLFLSKFLYRSNHSVASSTAERYEKIKPKTFIQYLFTFICSLIFLITFCLPLYQVIDWAILNEYGSLISNFKVLINSITLGIVASFLTVSISIILALSFINAKKLRLLITLSSSGYAVPGSVIAAGLLVSFNSIFNVSITTYGIIGLILCLALRFITPAFKYLTASLNNISPSSQNALSGFSVSSLKAFLLFYFPQMRPAILMSMLVVFIEVIKEQPATLLLRPVGFETLSSKIYNYTSEGQWILASLPSLFLIMICLVLVYILNKNIDSEINN